MNEFSVWLGSQRSLFLRKIVSHLSPTNHSVCTSFNFKKWSKPELSKYLLTIMMAVVIMIMTIILCDSWKRGTAKTQPTGILIPAISGRHFCIDHHSHNLLCAGGVPFPFFHVLLCMYQFKCIYQCFFLHHSLLLWCHLNKRSEYKRNPGERKSAKIFQSTQTTTHIHK